MIELLLDIKSRKQRNNILKKKDVYSVKQNFNQMKSEILIVTFITEIFVNRVVIFKKLYKEIALYK